MAVIKIEYSDKLLSTYVPTRIIMIRVRILSYQFSPTQILTADLERFPLTVNRNNVSELVAKGVNLG
jgi:hypothetical protein